MFGADFDRSLPATRRRREQSRLAGDIVQSRVLTTGVLLAVFAITWQSFGSDLLRSLVEYWRHSLSDWDLAYESASFDAAHFHVCRIASTIATWGVALFATALLTAFCQTHGWFVPGFACPRWSRLSPLDNSARVLQFLGVRFSTAIVSIGVCCACTWIAWRRFVAEPALDTETSVPRFSRGWSSQIEGLLLQAGVICIAVGLLELHIRHSRRESRLRMTPAELAEEERAA